MVVTPTPFAVTKPVVAFTVATAGLVLAHIPPAELVRVVVPDRHKVDTPVIGDGTGLTVTGKVRAHPKVET